MNWWPREGASFRLLACTSSDGQGKRLWDPIVIPKVDLQQELAPGHQKNGVHRFMRCFRWLFLWWSMSSTESVYLKDKLVKDGWMVRNCAFYAGNINGRQNMHCLNTFDIYKYIIYIYIDMIIYVCWFSFIPRPWHILACSVHQSNIIWYDPHHHTVTFVLWQTKGSHSTARIV